jgi:hypothetical protein
MTTSDFHAAFNILTISCRSIAISHFEFNRIGYYRMLLAGAAVMQLFSLCWL